MPELCDHEMVPAYCGACTGRDGGEAAEAKRRRSLLTRPGVIAARFSGLCEGCGDRFAAGEPIASVPGAPPAWRGPCCLDDRGVPAR